MAGYKVVRIQAAQLRLVKSTNDENLQYELNSPEYDNLTLHSVVPVQNEGTTVEFLLIFTE
jgi:hypothetical protein